MAAEKNKNYEINLLDYVCPDPEETDEGELFAELRAKTNIVMPCGVLTWCPYGRLAEAFPSVDCMLADLPTGRIPVPCARTRTVCPAYVLAREPFREFNPFAMCWDPHSEIDCTGCSEKCPRDKALMREAFFRQEHIALREAEAARLGWDVDIPALFDQLDAEAAAGWPSDAGDRDE